jgi:putative tryptophan/tyrosine transport system substrate-binding protein
VKRREFVTLLGGAAAGWPLAARAQQGERMRRIGVLMDLAENDPEGQARIAAFLQGLTQLGWTDGRNVRIDIRWATSSDDIRKYSGELIALAPDVILATGTPSLAPLHQVTRTVPIVFVNVVDPVGGGFVDSLARPGGNTTGFMLFEYGIGSKWLELLKEIAPRVTRVGVLRDPAVSSGTAQFGAIQSVAPSLGAEVSPINLRDSPEIEARRRGLRALRKRRADRDGEYGGERSSRSDRHVGGPAQTARGLQRTLLRHRRRPDVLRA